EPRVRKNVIQEHADDGAQRRERLKTEDETSSPGCRLGQPLPRGEADDVSDEQRRDEWIHRAILRRGTRPHPIFVWLRTKVSAATHIGQHRPRLTTAGAQEVADTWP